MTEKGVTILRLYLYNFILYTNLLILSVITVINRKIIIKKLGKSRVSGDDTFDDRYRPGDR